MIEIPEAISLTKQLNAAVRGKRITGVTAGASPHKFAWYQGDSGDYAKLLVGTTAGRSRAVGGMVEISCDQAMMVFTEGIVLRFLNAEENRPAKHQLLLDFEDGTALVASVRMYGGILAARIGELDNPYYITAGEKPGPLSDEFNADYFASILAAEDTQKLSTKAALATEQRIPGLGNGVLQDIVYEAGVHPKRRISSLSDGEVSSLFSAVRSVLSAMAENGGRDTETDLFGRQGGYQTKMSRNTVGKACPRCGTTIEKASYMGGSVYFCGGCQAIKQSG